MRQALLLLSLALDLLACTRWPITCAVRALASLWLGSIAGFWAAGMAGRFLMGEYPLWLGFLLYGLIAFGAFGAGIAGAIHNRPYFSPELYDELVAQPSPQLTVVQGGTPSRLLKAGHG